MNLKNKLIIITGASSGIGLACANESAKRGANLVLAARQYVKICEIANDLQNQYGVKVLAIQTDVSNEEDCIQLIKQSAYTFGKIDVLINNAGISMRALFTELDLEVIKQVMNINFWGTVYCTKYAIPYLIETKGTVVGVSSIAGFKGLPGRSGYSASKFAVNGFLESLRIENLKTGLNVLLACPGFTASNIRNVALNNQAKSQGETSMVEENMMSAEKVAKKIIDGIEAHKRQLVMTSQGNLTVFLQKFFPKLLDKLVYNHFKKEKNPLIV